MALSFCGGLLAQNTQNAPATDSSAQASPLRPAPKAPVTDSSAEASPLPPAGQGSAPRSIAPHTAIAVRLVRGIDSGHLKNGQTVEATLARPIPVSPRGTLPRGAPAQITVVETLAAGQLYAAGEFSLELIRVGGIRIYTDTLTYRGKPGPKTLPDSAPKVGTDAGLPTGAELTFHVLPLPAPAAGPPSPRHGAPGAIDGIDSGGPPPTGVAKQRNAEAGNGAGAGISTKPGSGKTNSAQARTITPPSNTPRPAQPLGKASPAPNQPAPPGNAQPTNSTQPQPQ